jgi:uncharacterized protein (TIGR02271 family)
MPLSKLKDFDPNYRDILGDHDVIGYDVYSDVGNQKVGTVTDILTDDDGHFRYLIVDLGFWIFGKKILLPIGRARIDYNARRVYALNVTREQAENLPEYKDNAPMENDYEDRVRGVYRAPLAETAATAATPAPVVSGPTDFNTYNYQQEPDLYGLNEQNHQTLKLYEERLIANKKRVKTGEVSIGKHVETQTAQVTVPIEKERIVVERTTPTDAATIATPGEATFREGEVARVEVYEETPDVRKEAVLREEVRVRKETDRDMVEAQDTIRREELDIQHQGNPVIDREANQLPSDHKF